MSDTSGILIKKPVSLLNKKINFNFGSFFTALTKAGANAAVANFGNIPENFVEVVASVGLGKEPGEVAWDLILSALIQAIWTLAAERKDLLQDADNKDIQTIVNYRLEQCLKKLELQEITIDINFFDHPESLVIIEEIKTPFGQWLESFGVSSAEAKIISNQIPSQFVYALHKEWLKNSDKYQSLINNLNSPFVKATARQQAWTIYSAWLENQVNERMFDEAFGLKQVYVPLRGYYKRKIKVKKSEAFGREEDKFEQIVVDLETEVENWLNKADSQDAIRVISGSPGSGKSSFAKIFAANQAKKGEVRVLFIPLHRFEVTDNLTNAVGNFVLSNGLIKENPLEGNNFDSRLLIIFDGLDELAMQGKLGAEVAKDFILKLERNLDNFNQRETRLQVLITGRDLTIQANSSLLDNSSQQILYVLPYFLEENERDNYIDEQKLLETDQRNLWWQRYGEAKGIEYTGLPSELDQGKLKEITAQPLLNYLVALSFARGEVDFSADSNLNSIYADLLKAVYERKWADKKKHPINQEFGIKDEEEFAEVLEEIALACWHGDGRTTTVSKIEKICSDNNHLKNLFEEYQQAAEAGVTRLLTAFYFRQSGVREQEKTFEFTHKSFGEYLTARRIVRELDLIHDQLEERQNNRRKGWDEKEALKQWAILCGTSPLNEYLFSFIFDEIRLQELGNVAKWQQTLCNLISFMLGDGMPMQELNLSNFHEENRQARNAEEALLVVLNACARVTKKVSEIQWHSLQDFGVWISRLRGQRSDFYNQIFCLNYLSYLDLQNCILIHQDFYLVDLQMSNLQMSNLQMSNLQMSNLQGANLEGANLQEVNLQWANLQWANLQWANLEGAYLELANLPGANLQGVNLQRANLQRAKLPLAYLEGANLQGAILEGAILELANLQRANFQGANLQGANLQGANVRGTILEGQDLTKLNTDTDSSTV
ncbi:pentapeptide repeat-containing protein [Anabaena cylindrica FACHB-243]|uniref:Pentapeptide repeat protein n=1 Tax=Anabaena cylindrica (strain ATCC 27899 / PCC 7122) TaxID=272123 RepID=K9ZLI5_ANACC|nr:MULTISPECIES: pentapeptide repeat-containing protein [Anabaena]AFZ60113.1 pentapeptide repeat protein [Anabaena cylindrica PCC 7122]MBD2417831.1 pentapeptide repeat-containing protein [Anabaena cylindrica FACHB-243]MCM2404746.1 pentapeptide repeat-containing protein [Anabaena sp. CCAP 1446/1C]BAY02820.1 pentapeptide repeat-containing protein [Anabaena cylindrica PCC 7122]